MSKEVVRVPPGLVRSLYTRWELNNQDTDYYGDHNDCKSADSHTTKRVTPKRNIPQLQNKFFQEILGRVYSQLEVVGFTLEHVRDEKANHTSCIVAVKVLTSYHSNVHLIFKSMNSSSPRAKVLNSKELFKKEALMYSNVIPSLIAANQDDPLTVFPMCYHVSRDLIVLDDLSSHGFRKINPGEGLDAVHCKLVLTELGRFHAASYALKNSDFADIHAALTTVSQEVQYLPQKKSTYEERFSQFARNTTDIIRGSPETCRYAKQVEDILINIHKYLKKILQPKEPFAVLTHGDLWSGNLMFSYSREEPVRVKFLDFQTCSYGSPALDINYFLYTSTTAEVRDRYMDEFMRMYYQSLMRTLRSMGLKLNLSLMDARREVDSLALYGFLATHLLQDVLVNSNSKEKMLENGSDDLYSKKITEIVCDLSQQGVF